MDGDSQMMINRASNKASLTGDIDLVLEGNKQSGTAGPVYTNRYNTGSTYLNSGGGNVGIGINPAVAPANKLEVNVATSTGSSGTHGVSVNDQAVNKQSINLGVNTAAAYSWIQSSKGGVGLRPLFLNPNGGGVSIGNTTDLGTGTLNVTGNITTIAGTTANHVVIKSQLDAVSSSVTSGSYTPTLTANGNITSLVLQSATWTKIGNIVTCQVIATGTLTASPANTSYIATLPFTRLAALKTVGVSSLIDNSSTPTGSGIGITQANATQAIFNVNYGGSTTGTGRTFIMNLTYDTTQ